MLYVICEVLVQDDLLLLHHNRVLRQTQALSGDCSTKGVAMGSGPHVKPELPSAASPAFWISWVLCRTQLGSGPSLQDAAGPKCPSLLSSAQNLMGTQRAEHLLQLFPGASIVTPILKNCLHPPRTYLGAEVGEVNGKSPLQFVLPTAPPKLGSWWAKVIHRAELMLRKNTPNK